MYIDVKIIWNGSENATSTRLLFLDFWNFFDVNERSFEILRARFWRGAEFPQLRCGGHVDPARKNEPHTMKLKRRALFGFFGGCGEIAQSYCRWRCCEGKAAASWCTRSMALSCNGAVMSCTAAVTSG